MRRHPTRIRTAFRTAAVVEAVTWVGLLTGMVLKYGPAHDERGVHLFGPLHGAAFLAYVGCVLLVHRTFRWRPRLTLLALACSVPPFASAVLELWAERAGRLDVRPVKAHAPDGASGPRGRVPSGA